MSDVRRQMSDVRLETWVVSREKVLRSPCVPHTIIFDCQMPNSSNNALKKVPPFRGQRGKWENIWLTRFFCNFICLLPVFFNTWCKLLVHTYDSLGMVLYGSLFWLVRPYMHRTWYQILVLRISLIVRATKGEFVTHKAWPYHGHAVLVVLLTYSIAAIPPL